MKKLINFIIVFLLLTTNIYAADESKKSLTKKETISFLKEYAIILEDERSDGEVTYVFDDENYSRYKGIEVISTDAWRFSKLGALRLFNRDIKMSWKIKITDGKNLINIKTKFDPIGKLYKFTIMDKQDFLDQIEQIKLAEKQKKEAAKKAEIEKKKKQEEDKLVAEQKLEEEKQKLEEERLAAEQKLENEKTPAQIKKEERERKKKEKLAAKQKAKEEKERIKQEKVAAKQKAKEEEERKKKEELAENKRLAKQKIEDEKEKKRIAEEKKILNYPSLIELIPFDVGAIEEKQLNDLKGSKIRVRKITINTIDDSSYTSLGKVSIYYMDGGSFKYLSLQCTLSGDNATDYLKFSNSKIKKVEIIGTVKMYRRSIGMVLDPCEWVN